MMIKFTKATTADISKLIKIEKCLIGTRTYSPMLEKKEWEETLQNEKVFILKVGNRFVGNISYKNNGDQTFHISGLAIRPEFQNQGIGRKAISFVLKNLKDAKRVDLAVHPDNARALKLYQSLGFVIESRKENYYGDNEPRPILALNKKRKKIE